MIPRDFLSLGPIRRLQWGSALLLLLVLAWAALAPLRYPTRERPLEFRRMSGARPGAVAGRGALPRTLHLTLGVRDVLLLRNRDAAPHVFGQVRVAPGHVFRLPFEQAGVFGFACDAAPGGQVLVRVGPYPDPGRERLTWRLRALADAVRTLPSQQPED